MEPADSASADRRPRADAVRNRDLLIAAAAEAFAARGADVSLEDIARGAGVGIGTLYRHFPTRDALVEAVYLHEVDVLCARADELLETSTPDQALAEWMQLFVRHVATKRGMSSLLKPLLSTNPTSLPPDRMISVPPLRTTVPLAVPPGRTNSVPPAATVALDTTPPKPGMPCSFSRNI